MRALDGVTLSVPRGAFCVLTGPSGSGKTTLLSILGVLARPTTGHISFDGRETDRFSEMEFTKIRGRIGWVFQGLALLPRLSIWENVSYPLIPRGIGRSERRRVAEELLVRLGLAAKSCARPETLSGGEQQRVAVARALVSKPDVVFADEPTSNLDPAACRVLALLLTEIHEAGTTVIVASHDPEFLSRASLHVELETGRLKTSAT